MQMDNASSREPAACRAQCRTLLTAVLVSLLLVKVAVQVVIEYRLICRSTIHGVQALAV